VVEKFLNFVIKHNDLKKSMFNLPLTKNITTVFEGVLSDTIVLHINHTLTDVYAFNAYMEKSLNAEIIFIGVPYNNKYYVPEYTHLYSLRSDIPFVPYENGELSKDIKPETDYIDLIVNQILYAVNKYILPKIDRKKVIIVQDGGYTSFFSLDNVTMNSLYSHKNFLGVVEQTSSGTLLLKQHYDRSSYKYPIISIAKSEIKSAIEAHFISDSVFSSLQEIFKRMGLFLSFKSVVIAGYGIIGRSLAFLLRNASVDVLIKEIDPILIKLARKEGFQCKNTITREDFEEATLYIGCTGQESFGFMDLDAFLKSNEKCFYLASGSSKRVEFWQLIKVLEESYYRKTKLPSINTVLRNVLDFSIEDTEFGLKYNFDLGLGNVKTLYLLGEGFPINFYNPRNDSVPDRAIDLTQSTLMHSIILLRTEYSKLKKDLDFYQNNIYIGDTIIDENTLLNTWMSLNKISQDYSYPLERFGLHPLRGYLMTQRYKLLK